MTLTKAVFIALCLGLAGCAEVDYQKTKTGAFSGLIVLTDAETGCQYTYPSGRSGITPRIAADGKTHMGCKEAK